ncbi:MAG: nuclear transport factor 2 family protein [Phycisphaeraceae bacterium]|nr:MAG: nuclear transport factor 2 family protein [Phycisphaeraceae bacterium]
MITVDHPIAKIAQDVVDHVNSGAASDVPLWDKHWHPEFVSVEGDGMTHTGKENVLEKHKMWHDSVTMHACTAHGPYVTQNGFCVRYELDCEANDGSWPRMTMDEIAVYTVRDGKVVREEFFGRPMPAGCCG